MVRARRSETVIFFENFAAKKMSKKKSKTSSNSKFICFFDIYSYFTEKIRKISLGSMEKEKCEVGKAGCHYPTLRSEKTQLRNSAGISVELSLHDSFFEIE